MNPETNKLVPLYGKVEDLNGDSKPLKYSDLKLKNILKIEKLVLPDGSPVPEHWSQFEVGEKIVMRNYTFKIAHIGESYIVLEPVGPIIIGEEK